MTYCKECDNKKKKLYCEMNPDKIRQKAANYYKLNAEVIKAKVANNYNLNKDKLLEYQKLYSALNKVKIATRSKKYREENSKYFTEYYRNYYYSNTSEFLARNNKRRAQKLKATPPWLTPEQLEQIKELYTCAQMFKLYTGEEYHVDHIVPLQGENVCGLHVPWNLQVIPAKENLSKSNKLQEDIL